MSASRWLRSAGLGNRDIGRKRVLRGVCESPAKGQGGLRCLWPSSVVDRKERPHCRRCVRAAHASRWNRSRTQRDGCGDCCDLPHKQRRGCVAELTHWAAMGLSSRDAMRWGPRGCWCGADPEESAGSAPCRPRSPLFAYGRSSCHPFLPGEPTPASAAGPRSKAADDDWRAG